MFFVFHHLTWMVVAFDGYRRKSLWRVVFVAASNALASILVCRSRLGQTFLATFRSSCPSFKFICVLMCTNMPCRFPRVQVALESTPIGCAVSLPLQFALLVVNAAVVWHCIHRPAYRSKLRSL